MSDHISKSLIEQFRDRSLDVTILSDISAHLESCDKCYELFREAFRVKRENAPLSFSLSSSRWLKDEHFDYEQLVSYVDGNPGDEDREILDEHLKLCGRCREDLQSFVLHRQQIEPELKVRYAPSETQPKRRNFVGWWESFKLPLKPAYAVYALLLVSTLVVVTTLLRRGGSTETPFHSATPTVNVTPTSAPNVISTPTSTPIENTITSQSSGGTENNRGEPGDRRALNRKTPSGAEPTNWRDSEKLAVSLLDGGRQISLDDTGNLTGLEDLPASNRRLVKETLSSGELQRPVILNDFVVEKSSTRSNTSDQPSFKLISPGQAVIVETKPVFKWEPLKGALGYKIYIASRANWAGMASPTLDSSTFEWIPPTHLRRGETYTWVVSAITEKGELTVPASSEPERKFKVLGERDFNALIKLKRHTSSHMMLGLFYVRSGLVFEAEKELQLLANENANSTFAAKLLDQVRSWR
jgi:hypothetical protein